MSQTTVTFEPNTQEAAKHTAARLGRVIDIWPSCKSLTESTHLSGVFNTFNAAGIPQPDAALVISDGGAGVMSGDRAVYGIYRDGNRDVVGNPGTISNTLTITSKIISVDLTQFTNERDNDRVTDIDLYVNLSTGGSIYYYAGTVVVGTATATINVSDATIQANDTLELDNDAPVAEEYGSALVHKSYMFLVGSHSDVSTEFIDDFTWGKVNSADQFPLLNRTKVEPGMYGRLNIAVPSGDTLLFYKERAIYLLTFNQDPSGVFGDGFAKTVNTLRGTVNKRTVANVQGTHFSMDYMGIFVTTSGKDYRELSMKLHRYWKRINWARKEWFTAAVDKDRVYFFVALDGDTECRYAFVLDLNAWWAKSEANWYVYEFDQGIRDAASWTIGPGAAAVDNGMTWHPVVSVLTEYGYTGYLAAGYRDMMDPLLTAEGTTSTAGTTTTFVDSTATWQRTNDAGSTVNPVGAYVRFINPSSDKPGSADWSQAYRITAYSGTGPTLTFTPAAPANVPSGTAYVIGAIPNAALHSPVFGFDAAHRAKRASNVVLEHQTGGMDHTCNLQVSLDRRATYLTRMTRDKSTFSSDDRLLGVDVKMGGALDAGARLGVQAAPAGGQPFRYLQIILRGNVYGGHAIDNPTCIDGVMIEGLTMAAPEVYS